MKNLEIYKEFYFREIDRKNELNNIINIPIIIITGIISVQFYFYSQQIENSLKIYLEVLSIISALSILYSIFYLLKSFGNFFKNHSYKELNEMNSIYKYERELIKEQKKTADAESLFLEYLNEQFSDCASHNFLINKTRTEDIAKSKKGIFISTILFSIIFLISIITMAKKTENTKPIVKPVTTIQQPQSVLIKNSKQTKETPKTNIKRSN
ncbi:hypothetical protein [Flavobacterium ammonificans]|uniref:SLATT domain-containing protein n=1 Tax=Flavobacterium ammonificans TaxID=1751056 RepID=A0ABN6KSP0_9FLAO|nr:hypothetical protein [Flavobacterium ammonificans]BDB52149.1 hypothetical protein GENT11_04610 [Flavobacterium ammonificans]